MGGGLWEIRTDLPTKRTERATPDEYLALARKRKKELQQ